MTGNEKQRGMVLLGVLIALGVLALISARQMGDEAVDVANLQWQQTAREGLQILDATRNAYADASPALADRWPVDPAGTDTRIDTLINGGYLVTGTSVYGTDWTLAVVVDTLTARLSLVVPDTTTARVLAAQLPQGVQAGTVVTAMINRPGDEAIHSTLRDRSGLRSFTGDADADNHTLTDVAGVTYAP